MIKERKDIRLKGFDYKTDAFYFLTFCTDKRLPCLSAIESASIKLTEYGRILEKYMDFIRKNYKQFNIYEYAIMPNHVHLIAGIVRMETNIGIPQLISMIKSLSSRDIRKNGLPYFAWQRNYFDRIIRSDMEYHNIANYINNNPAKWADDIENPDKARTGKEKEYYEAVFDVLNP